MTCGVDAQHEGHTQAAIWSTREYLEGSQMRLPRVMQLLLRQYPLTIVGIGFQGGSRWAVQGDHAPYMQLCEKLVYALNDADTGLLQQTGNARHRKIQTDRN